MKHLGDITKINVHEVPTVDCIIGGSPCQDLSMAGLRKGLAGDRSGLYMEQIRIIKEMRENDRVCGRTGVDVRPRYIVWENVPGAFSTNKGQDFAAVLEEAIRVTEPEAPSVPVPEKGWPTAGCLCDEMGKWSVAWRVMDAQYWGVPQRRRRICLVGDFNGLNAPKIVFGEAEHHGSTERGHRNASVGHSRGKSRSKVRSVTEGLSGNTDPCQQKGQENAGDAGEGAVGAIGCDIYNGALSGDKAVSLNTNANATGAGPTVAVPKVVYGIGGYYSKGMMSDNPTTGYYEADTYRTLDALNCGYPGCNQGGMAVVQPMACAGVDCRNATEYDGHTGTLQAKSNGGISYNCNNVVRVKHIVRRLTPLECERLQGYPDNWTLIGEPVEEEVADYAYIFDESKYIAPNPANFGLTYEDLNDYAPVDDEDSIDDEDVYDDNYLEYLDACAKALSKATKRVKVGSHKETNHYYTDSNGKRKKVSDSARYKALGNSIAIPPWKWVLKRLCACYERDATMASLFDGIGGFPYIWEQLNGKGSCLWASEIEEFPMAVTKVRIGE